MRRFTSQLPRLSTPLHRLRFLALATAPLVATATEVQLQNGFHATVGEAVPMGNKASAYSYQVRGGMTLHSAQGEQAFSVDCVGLDVTDSSGETVGTGHCVWRDIEDHHLFLSLQTADGHNTYTVTGGSGMWESARGTFRTGFSDLPGPGETVFLGVESGAGTLEQ